MPLADTFVRQVKPSGKPAGDSHADGGGMYLLVKPTGKYWRMDYRFAGKRKTLAQSNVKQRLHSKFLQAIPLKKSLSNG